MRMSKSPLRTHVFNPMNLPLPTRDVDPKYVKQKDGQPSAFESTKVARMWDQRRSKRLVRSDDLDAHEFGEWLAEATVAGRLPMSLASFFYFFILRSRLPGALINFLATMAGGESVLPFTIVPPEWCVKQGHLNEKSAKQWVSKLRNLLVTQGVEAAEGFLFASLHGEFDGKYYKIHFHGIAVGNKAKALRSLLDRDDMKEANGVHHPYEREKTIALDDYPNLVRWLTYCLKGWWPSRPLYLDENGKLRRPRYAQRLPKDCEEEFLRWMTSQNFGELVLLQGFRLTDLTKAC
jgi:hypothetical protein